MGRHAFVEFVNIDIAIAVHDERAHATILALRHAAQFVVLALGDIDGIWVDLVEHVVDARLDEIVVVEGVHVVDVQLAHDVGVDGEILVDACGLGVC